jgi:ribosome recycling factor
MSTIAQIVKDARSGMEKAVDASKRDFSGIRSGKASPNMLDTVRVEVYGSMMQLNQVASVSAPEPRILMVMPFDKGQAKAIEKAIRDSDLGVEPSNQGGIIRVPLPQMTEERRKDLVKVLHKLAEDGRIAIRHARTDGVTSSRSSMACPRTRRSTRRRICRRCTTSSSPSSMPMLKVKEAEVMEV